MNSGAWEALGTCVAVVVSVAALLVAWRQTRAANARAEAANAISGQANTLATEANAFAQRALDLAQSAEARADRLERIQVERRDVQWEHREVKGGGVASFQNVGADTAFDVQIVVLLDQGRTSRESPVMSSVASGERMAIGLQAEAREAKQAWQQLLAAGALGTPGVTLDARITWRSEAGVPGVQTVDNLRV